jgi:hypothetical protein
MLARSGAWGRLLAKDFHVRRFPCSFYSNTTHQSHHQPQHSGAHSHEHYVPLTQSEVAARDKFSAVYSRSITDPEKFWGEAAESIVW